MVMLACLDLPCLPRIGLEEQGQILGRIAWSPTQLSAGVPVGAWPHFPYWVDFTVLSFPPGCSLPCLVSNVGHEKRLGRRSISPVSSFDWGHGSQMKVTTQVNLLYRIRM